MSFTIRNHGTALYEDQAEIDALDWSIVLDALNGSGIFTGCQTTAQTTPDGSLAVSAGTYRVTGSDKTFAGGSVSVVSGSANPDGSTASAADANWARYDLIVLNASNQIGVIHGVTDPPTFPNIVSNPVFPSYNTATQVVIAAVYVTPGLTAIISGLFTPKDVKISKNAFHDQVHSISGSTHSGTITNAQHGILSVASAHAASHITFTPTGKIAATDVQAAIAEAVGEDETQITFAKAGALAASTVGTFRWYNDTGRTLTFVSARASVGTAPTGSGNITVDVNKDGTTIMTGTKVVIALTTFTTKQTTFSTTTIADGSYLTVDIDSVGGTVAGSDLTVNILMRG